MACRWASLRITGCVAMPDENCYLLSMATTSDYWRKFDDSRYLELVGESEFDGPEPDDRYTADDGVTYEVGALIRHPDRVSAIVTPTR
jgi:hypothetical protein